MESNSMKSKVELQRSHQEINLNEKEFQTNYYKKQFQSKLDTLESVRIQCDVGYQQENAKLLVKALSSSKILTHVQLISKNETPCKLLPHLTARVSSLQITIPISTNNDPQKVCQAISELKSIEKLALTLNYSTNYKKETFGTFVSHLNLKSNNLTHLSFVLNNIVAHTIDVLSFSQKIAECHSLKHLSIKQEHNGFLLDGIEQLIRNLTTSTFKLQSFKFQFRKIIPTENTIALLREFFQAQSQIEVLELNQFQVQTNLFNNFFIESLTQLTHLKSIFLKKINLFFFEGNIKSLVHFFEFQKLSLEEININLQATDINCEQLVELARVFEQMQNLKFIILELYDKTLFKEQSAIYFANSIVNCKKLNHLQINLGSSVKILLKGSTPSETIFQMKKIKAEFTHSSSSSLGDFYYILLRIVKENYEINSLQIINTYIMYTCILKNEILKLEQQILSQAKNLRELHLTISDQKGLSSCFEPIKNNQLSLVSLSITNYQISKELLDTISTLPNLLFFKFSNYQFTFKEIMNKIPNLIGLDFSDYYQTYREIQRYGYSDLISSNICDIKRQNCQKNRNPQFEIERTPFDCIEHKRSTLISLFIFEQYIKASMLNNPQEVVYDLWGNV